MVGAGTVVSHAGASRERQLQVAVVGGSHDVASVDDAGAGERCGIVHVLDHARRALAGVRLVGVVHVAAQVDLQRGALRHGEVEVRAVVEPLVGVVQVIGEAEVVEQAALRIGSGRDEVAHRLRAARDAQVVLALERPVLHDVVRPTGVGEADGVRVVLELLDNLVREHRYHPVQLAHPVVERGIVVRVCLFHHLCRCQDTGRRGEGYLRLAFCATFGRYQDDAVCPSDAEYSRGGSILQDGDALDFIRVDVVHAAFHAVDLNQRR